MKSDVTSGYTLSTIRGLPVIVRKDLLAEDNVTAKECLALLDYKLTISTVLLETLWTT